MKEVLEHYSSFRLMTLFVSFSILTKDKHIVQKGLQHMTNTESINKQGMEDDPPGQQLTGEQATTFQQLLHLQSDIEGQGHRVAMAINPIAEALDKGGKVSPEMINHVKAQILLAHLQLDDLEQLLDSID
jgi:hypothetical protein